MFSWQEQKLTFLTEFLLIQGQGVKPLESEDQITYNMHSDEMNLL